MLIVSNRLPVTVEFKKGKLRFHDSIGGLATGLKSVFNQPLFPPLKQGKVTWVGWPGITLNNPQHKQLEEVLMSKHNSYPVRIPLKNIDKFYNGFCNKTIWPLFHYQTSYTIFEKEFWNNYRSVNETYANTVAEILKPNDFIWIHDYHLMLLPKMLRNKFPDITIGFFLHIPFPTFEIFRILPSDWREEILKGILGADLIGFHTFDYSQYFLRCVLRILGHDHNMGKVAIENRIVKVDAFPMGIDFDKFSLANNNPEVNLEIKRLQSSLNKTKTILSFDRLDYTKGISNRLEGYELFLEQNPKFHKKIVLLLFVAPSRIGVERYQIMKKEINELVGKINGKFGSIEWTPILYQQKPLSFHQLAALYSISDIALITPLRDGMNLIAKEYVASRSNKSGVLILSEMTGAAKELGDAILINPNDRHEISNAIKKALIIPQEEQSKRLERMHAHLSKYNIMRWMTDFLQGINSIKEDQNRFKAKLLSEKIKANLINEFKSATKRIIFLDYDGTLVPFTIHPHMANPSSQLIDLLNKLEKSKQTKVVIISGRTRNSLDDWFKGTKVNLAAEHGVWIKDTFTDWEMIKPLKSDWKSLILPLVEIYVDRLPGSFLEEKEFSIAWHFRAADSEIASIKAKEFTDFFINFTANIDIQIIQGEKVIEIRNSGINKGTAGLYWLTKENYDFILSIGDDWTDEDLFNILPKSAYSIKIGLNPSHAKYNLKNHLEVINLLEELVLQQT